MKSFLKYCGGKAKLLPSILNIVPDFENYFEPFVGGGSVFLNINLENKACSISDINSNLINCYNIIKNNLEALITELSNNVKYSNTLESYLSNRNRYNAIKNLDSEKVEQAALFIYLNKCGFNGMYRENKSGIFNVPFGNMKNPIICNSELLGKVSKYLQDINISNGDYKTITPMQGDLVYLDPPYHGAFNSYTLSPFDIKEQIELKEFIDLLTKSNVKIILSNSSTDFIKDLYKDYTISIIKTRYSVGGKGASRSIKEELLITNF